MDERKLAQRAQRGDQDAFALLVERCQGQVYNLALRLPSFQWDCAFSTWLYRLAHNAAIDFLRRRAHQRGAESPLSLDEEENGLAALTPDPGPSPQELVEHKQLQEALAGGLARLSPDHRQALALRLSGLSYAEIARTLDLEEGTVKSRIARARLSLRNYLKKTGNLPAPAASKQAERGGEDA